MKRFLFSILLLLISFPFISAQNYAVGYKRDTWRDATRNRNIPVLIYYPATAAGLNQPILQNGSKFPAIAFGHGFLMKGEEFTYLADKLCPQGYILIFPKSEEGLPPNHGEFGKDEVFCALEMVRKDTLSGDFFNGVVASKKAVGGHSMGGGAVFLGLQSNPNIDAFFALAPAETFIGGSAVQAAKTIRIPGLIFTGTYDKVAPKAGNGGFMYNNLISSCKLLVELKGGSHCGFSNPSADACDLGEAAVCLGCPFITNAEQHTLVFKYLEPWLNFWLKGTIAGISNISTTAATDAKILFTNGCVLTGINNNRNNNEAIELFPNPTKGNVFVKFSENASKIEIFGIDGKLLQTISGKFIKDNQIELDIQNLQVGMYMIRCTLENGTAVKSFVIE